MIYVEGKSMPYKRFETLEEAEKEAERLCEKETIKRVFYDLSNQPKNDAKKIVDKFYNNSNFLIKINQQNRLLLAKTSAIIHVELLIENLIYRYGNEDFTGKPYFENLIKEIDKL